MRTLLTLVTTGPHGETIGTPSFLLPDRGGEPEGNAAVRTVAEAVNRWFMETEIGEARQEASGGMDDYNWGDLLCSSVVLDGLRDYGIEYLDGEVPEGGPYGLVAWAESHHERLLERETVRRLFPDMVF